MLSRVTIGKAALPSLLRRRCSPVVLSRYFMWRVVRLDFSTTTLLSGFSKREEIYSAFNDWINMVVLLFPSN